MDRLVASGREWTAEGLPLLGRKQETDAGDGRMVWLGQRRASATTASISCLARRAISSRPLAKRNSRTSTVDMQRVYLVTLAKDTESPLGPRSDEVGKGKKKDEEKEEGEKKGEEKKGEQEGRQGRRSRSW